MKKNNVVPLYISPGYVDNRFLASIADSQHYNKNQLPPIGGSSARINLARTEVIKAFLKTEAEWAWFVDTDMVFGPTVLPQLLATAKEKKAQVVAALCFVYDEARSTIVCNAYQRNPNQGEGDLRYKQAIRYPDEPFEVDATGSACLLVRRTAILDVSEQQGGFYPWFDEAPDPLNGFHVGPDLLFCERLKEAGHQIWYEPRAKVGHIRQSIIGEREYLQWLRLLSSSQAAGASLGAT